MVLCECVLSSVCYFGVPLCIYLCFQGVAAEAASTRWTSKILVSCELVRPSRRAQRTPTTIDRVPALQSAATTTTQSIRHEYLVRLRQLGVLLVGVIKRFIRASNLCLASHAGTCNGLWSALQVHFDCRGRSTHPRAHLRKHRTTWHRVEYRAESLLMPTF